MSEGEHNSQDKGAIRSFLDEYGVVIVLIGALISVYIEQRLKIGDLCSSISAQQQKLSEIHSEIIAQRIMATEIHSATNRLEPLHERVTKIEYLVTILSTR